ncbi:MAG TPA: C39 family peptidase [Chthoniobacterales bacterium]|jgi:hypothetical protein|nr:C39 family peptidase [Chthoniobacterales bacterium]
MQTHLKPSEVSHLAAIELNLLNFNDALPGMHLEHTWLGHGIPIYDPSGEVLFYRFPIRHESVGQTGYADVAAQTLFGDPLLATAPDASWNAEAWIAQAQSALERLRHDSNHGEHWSEYDEIRIVAFSFPKLAVQFLKKGTEVVMLELGTWAIVPPAERRDRKPMEPSSFERWSLVEEMPEEQKVRAHERFTERAKDLERIELRAQTGSGPIARANLDFWITASLPDTRELHYSTRSSDHHTCYELRGQETNVWCVAASVQMVLDFYRYEYSQSRIAQRLNLGTLQNPSGLPYANDNDVAVQLNAMSSGALTAVMLTAPPFAAYTAEIRANRPLVSFVPGHSRTVVGYTQSNFLVLGGSGFEGLLVYDPWPPNAGVITRWENFVTQTYRRAFTAKVTTI